MNMTSPAPAAEIKYKIGNERLVKVTDPASAKLRSLLERQGRPQGALRVAVIGGGCSGLQYKMDLVDGPANRDIMVESAQVRVVVDPKERAVRQRVVARLQRRSAKRRVQGDEPERRGALFVRREFLGLTLPAWPWISSPCSANRAARGLTRSG